MLRPSTRTGFRRGAAALAIALVTSTGAAGVLGSGATAAAASQPSGHLDPGLPTTGSQQTRVIVSARAGHSAAAAHAVRALGGQVGTTLSIIDGFAATLPAAELPALARDSAVLAVTANRAVQLDKHSADSDSGKTASKFVSATGADEAWSRGDYGAGVGVAVLDTGISDVNDLAGRVVHGPDLSGEGTSVDTYGHGTAMAGLIAGNGADSVDKKGRGGYTGIAPSANVIAVKVAGRNASVDVSTVLQGMHWVAAYRSEFNIRVLNLSWGVPSTQDPSVDPLNYAVERLWRLGIVVVVAAGNGGPNPGTITKPGDDPLVITVGALDDRGKENSKDVAPWSSRGPTAAGLAKPDLVAPGRKVVTVRSFGSFIEQTFPKALVGSSYIRGSGTSEATAIVSGDVALLLAQRPDLTPDQVKYLLKSTADPVRKTSQMDSGAGQLQLDVALDADATNAPVQTFTSSGLGSLEMSRAGMHVATTCGATFTAIVGEVDTHCEPWDGTTWTGTTWTGTTWTGTTWTSAAWTPAVWTGTTWTGGTWTGGSWQGVVPWTGTTWTGTTWTGTTWTGTTWTGTTWTSFWAGTTWTGIGVLLPTQPQTDVFETAFWGDGPTIGHDLPGEQTQLPTPPAVSPLFAGSLW